MAELCFPYNLLQQVPSHHIFLLEQHSQGVKFALSPWFFGKRYLSFYVSANDIFTLLKIVCFFVPQMHDMQPMSRFYDSGTCSKKYNFHSAANFMDVLSYKKLLATSKSKEDTKVISAQKHKEAERKRRIRINDQYANLRTVLPNLIKVRKALHFEDNQQTIHFFFLDLVSMNACCYGNTIVLNHRGTKHQCLQRQSSE